MNHYIVVFSILVLTSGAEHLELFTQEDIKDTSLPLHSIPESYRESRHKEAFEDFLKAQWKFCPLHFSIGTNPKPSKKNLSPRMIIPISPVGKIKINPEAKEETDAAVLYKVEFHPHSTLLTTPVVFKEYLKSGPEIQKLYDNEWALYTQLKEDSFNHIVRYHGSFQCLDRRTIVLEYAPGGDLLSYFRKRKPPSTDWHRKQFWQNLFGLLEGLVAIDDLTRYGDQSRDTWHLKGTHQDIRPQNILICGEPSDDDYSVPFKFADMGLAHIRKVKNEGIDRFATDHFGNGMYSAPEAFRDDGGIKTIRHKSDVYSLGGILSEALIWALWGERGREAYQAERVEATREIRLKGGYHEGAFHDGDGLLTVVERWHERAVDLTGGKAEALSQLIVKSMLAADPDRRKTAAELLENFTAIIPTLESDSSPRNYMSKRQQGWPLSPLSLATRSQTTPIGPRDAYQSPTPIARSSRVSSMQTNKSSIATFLTASPDLMEPFMSPLNVSTHEYTRPVDALHIGRRSDPQFGPQNNSSGPGCKGKLPASYSLPSQQEGPFFDETSSSRFGTNRTSLPIRTGSNRKKTTAQEPGRQSPRILSPVSTLNSRPATNVGSTMSPQHLSNGESSSHVFQQPSALQHAKPSLAGITVGSGSVERSQRKTSSEPPITIDQIWQTCFEPGGRSTHHFGRKLLRFNSETEDPLKAFPALQKTLKRLKGNNGRNQVNN
ncbi:tein kinase 4-like protein [Colletotrichum chrysophilum]|uniref:non-specific serine/threonine protein kinase n=1 Tax=Colletotrichum chrysophilum TaxID=1836956 RepID=A0AAD9A593_9PEZI|nr:tein kinase 4-like protein [Colletotrichum chrysophilum]